MNCIESYETKEAAEQQRPTQTDLASWENTDITAEADTIYRAHVIGDGSAGSAIFVAADGLGRLDHLLRGDRATAGVAWSGRAPKEYFGPGGIQKWRIRSNSPGSDHIEAVSRDGEFGHLLESPVAKPLQEKLGECVWLDRELAPFLHAVGQRAIEIIESTDGSLVRERSEIVSVNLSFTNDGRPVWTSIDRNGDEVRSENVVLATGAREVRKEEFGKYGGKVATSGEVISESRLKELRERLEQNGRSEKPVAIVGSSHSALSVAWKLLEQLGRDSHYGAPVDFEDGDITIYHRGPIALFYPNREAAVDDGYEFGEDEVCQLTGRVWRFGGLREDAKRLYKDIISGKESRVKLVQYDGDPNSVENEIGAASVVCQCTGYQANQIQFYDERGNEIGPVVNERGKVEVDQFARAIGEKKNDDGETQRVILPGVYSQGLGHGVAPSDDLGGEKAFNGILEAINLSQGYSGQLIVQQILDQRLRIEHWRKWAGI